jgi:hypothetical protein
MRHRAIELPATQEKQAMQAADLGVDTHRALSELTYRALNVGVAAAAFTLSFFALRDLQETPARLRDLVEVELSHRAGPVAASYHRHALDVPAPAERR